MKQFAQVIAGKVILTAECADDHVLECTPPLRFITITPETGTPSTGWTWNGSVFVAPPVPTLDDLKPIYIDAIQAYMDREAQAHGYDGILSLCSYAPSENHFGAEGRAGLAWRDLVWLTGYGIMNQIYAGTRPVPTVDELLADLPRMEWPA
jgi:hypothetical protein